MEQDMAGGPGLRERASSNGSARAHAGARTTAASSSSPRRRTTAKRGAAMLHEVVYERS